MNGYFILLVALAISAVAAYYSIVGLATLFAAAAIPVIIMGATLEVAKLVTASWLYNNWKKIPFLLKSYFTIAVVVLMFITSMGIFGFLSKAHIQQTGEVAQFAARLEQIPSEIGRIDNTIARNEASIQKLSNQESSAFNTIQEQIDAEQKNIDEVYKRIQPDVDRLQNIIDEARQRKESAASQVTLIETYIKNDQIKELQALVGVKPDGDFGPNTQAAVEAYKVKIQQEAAAADPIIAENEAKIVELRRSLDPLVAESNELIKQLRAKINVNDTIDVTPQINELEAEIKKLEEEKDKLLDEKFAMEDEVRKIEVEVGPVKYIAEFIYGEADTNVIEEAVRWVILIIIFVFDPLAVLLVIAANMTIREQKAARKLPRPIYSDKDVTFPDPVPEIVDNVKEDIISTTEGTINKTEDAPIIPKNTRNFKYYEMLKNGLTNLRK